PGTAHDRHRADDDRPWPPLLGPPSVLGPAPADRVRRPVRRSEQLAALPARRFSRDEGIAWLKYGSRSSSAPTTRSATSTGSSSRPAPTSTTPRNTHPTS